MKKVRLEIYLQPEEVKALQIVAQHCNQCRAIMDGSATHGSSLTAEKLLEMLVEDVALMVTQPESWQSANMKRVFAGHGYQVSQVPACHVEGGER